MNHPHPQSSESFGELLRLLRQRAHLTQRELAVIVGYSDAQINRYEKGARTPDPSVVAALFLKALGLEPESDLAARLVALAHKPVQIVINGMTIDANIDQQLRAKLPSPTTDLLGRDSDIKSVLEMLSCDNVRMLTLVGPPGVGKTRLAIQLAVELESQYQHGAIFVALAAIADGSLIPDGLLQALGVTSNAQNPLAQVKNVLRKRNMLLVLDNFEHLLDFPSADMATGVITALLASAPHIKVLVTSRAPLHLSSEHIYEVPSLTPAAARDLFVSRATALSPAFKPRPYDEQAIAGICKRLDYLPLAIELAAARIRLFEPPALLKRLAAPLDFLTGGPKDLPQRQRTLRNAIGWSYQLLAPEEQTVFRRLSIFADGCTMTMIEAIADRDLTSPVVDIVQSLVDKSLLKTERVNGTIRFSLLEMLREYASELLANTPEAETIAKRSAQWFVDQVYSMQSTPAIGDSAIWFDWFDLEKNNLRAIIQWSLHSNHVEYGLQLAANLGMTWRMYGPMRDGWQLVSQLLKHPNVHDYIHLYGQTLLAAAHVADQIGENDLSKSYLLEALDIFRQENDTYLIAQAMTQLGGIEYGRSAYTNASELLAKSIAMLREIGDLRGLTVALLWVGSIELDQGNLLQALLTFDEMWTIARDIQSDLIANIAAGYTAITYFALGEFDRARHFAEIALSICESLRLSLSINYVHGTLGNISLYQGNIDLAIFHLKKVDQGMERHGSPEARLANLVNLGFATHLNGNSAEAQSMLHEALQAFWESQHILTILEILNRLAWIAVDMQNFSYAVCLMGTVDALRRQLSIPFLERDQIFHQPRLQMAKSSLNPVDFDLYWRAGQAMDCKAAVAYILSW